MTEERKLKKGDQVVMHTCGEALFPKNFGKVWTCKTDEYTTGEGLYEQRLVFLEGFSGSFMTEYLQKIDLTCHHCGGSGRVEVSYDPYMSLPCECVVFDQVLENYPKLKQQNKQLIEALTSVTTMEVGPQNWGIAVGIMKYKAEAALQQIVKR